MKITKENLKKLIKEELLNVLEQKGRTSGRTETPPISLRNPRTKKRDVTQNNNNSNNNNRFIPPAPRRSTGQQLVDIEESIADLEQMLNVIIDMIGTSHDLIKKNRPGRANFED